MKSGKVAFFGRYLLPVWEANRRPPFDSFPRPLYVALGYDSRWEHPPWVFRSSLYREISPGKKWLDFFGQKNSAPMGATYTGAKKNKKKWKGKPARSVARFARSL
jgi:hypothetical protein